jgi:CheY-like chemotaxis protein
MSDERASENYMLVDDDPDENFVNKRTLSRSKLAKKIWAFENPIQAIDWLKQEDREPVHVLIVDINMPEMNGFEFLERHNELPAHLHARTVIMLLTTSLNPKDIDRVKEYETVVYQNKPLRPEMIIEILDGKSIPQTR